MSSRSQSAEASKHLFAAQEGAAGSARSEAHDLDNAQTIENENYIHLVTLCDVGRRLRPF